LGDKNAQDQLLRLLTPLRQVGSLVSRSRSQFFSRRQYKGFPGTLKVDANTAAAIDLIVRVAAMLYKSAATEVQSAISGRTCFDALSLTMDFYFSPSDRRYSHRRRILNAD
jgi:hypothetical protein